MGKSATEKAVVKLLHCARCKKNRKASQPDEGKKTRKDNHAGRVEDGRRIVDS